MTPLFLKILGMNWLLVLVTAVLLTIGVYSIHEATAYFENSVLNSKWYDQIKWICIGIILSIVVQIAAEQKVESTQKDAIIVIFKSIKVKYRMRTIKIIRISCDVSKNDMMKQQQSQKVLIRRPRILYQL